MTTTPTTTRRRGAVGFLLGSVAVHVGNYAFNLVAIRSLPPAQYADVALAVTLLLLAGFVTVGLQMATARTVAEAEVSGDEAGPIAQWFRNRAFRLGTALGLTLVLVAPVLAATFRTTSAAPFLAVAAALPWAFATGVGRGWAQGTRRFGRLAMSFQAEMVVRLALGSALVVLGLGVPGAVVALALSVMAAAAIVRPPGGPRVLPTDALRRRVLTAVGPSLVLLAGEALVTHIDTVVVKQAFDAALAGRYAAIALLGRSVFFLTWPVAVIVFPVAAARAAASRPTGRLLAGSVSIVGALGAAATGIAFLMPEHLVDLVLGEAYVPDAYLLAPYLAATTLFSCAATVLSFHLATGRNVAGVVAGAAGVVTAAVLVLIHPTRAAVVWLQVVLMAGYLAGVLLWTARPARGGAS